MVASRFLRLLVAEMEGCEEDLQDLDELLRRRLTDREITEYVYRENDALLRQEVQAVRQIRLVMRDVKFNPDVALDEAVDEARKMIREQVDHHHYPLAVLAMVERRIQRIRHFLLQE